VVSLPASYAPLSAHPAQLPAVHHRRRRGDAV
jgi:hypothetical protein